MFGWRLPSPAWNTLPTRARERPRSRSPEADLRQARARNDAVHHPCRRASTPVGAKALLRPFQRSWRSPRRGRRTSRAPVLPARAMTRSPASPFFAEPVQLDEEGRRRHRADSRSRRRPRRLMVSWSIISMAAGTRPRPITANTDSEAALHRVETASTVFTACGRRGCGTMILVAMPKVPRSPRQAGES